MSLHADMNIIFIRLCIWQTFFLYSLTHYYKHSSNFCLCQCASHQKAQESDFLRLAVWLLSAL